MGVTGLDLLKEGTDVVIDPGYEDLDDSSGETRTHIVNPPKNLHIWEEGMSAQDIVDVARFNGYEVVALCGYRWIPKQDPQRFPACETCIEIAGDLMRGAGE